MELYGKDIFMNIFFDLDGTLIDSRQRLYQLFQHLVPQSNLSFDAYWEMKRNKIGHGEILRQYFYYTEDSIKDFQEKWMKRIELPEWLEKDIPFDGVSNFLKKVSQSHTLYIVTARQFREEVIKQVKKFGWSDYFKGILVTEQKVEKFDLIKTVENISEEDWLVTDTGKDINTGKKLGIRTAGVLSGFLNRDSLLEYKPDIILPIILDFKYKELENE